MICQYCNTNYDDNAPKCPCCGAPTKPIVDLNKPADPAPAVELNKLADPAPAAPQPQAPVPPPAAPYGQPQADPYVQTGTQGTTPYAQPQQGYTQSSYTDPSVYAGAAMGGAMNDANLEKEANTIQLLGIISLIGSICCGCIVGLILGIVDLVKINGIKDKLIMISPEGQKKVNTGKILSIVSLGIYVGWIVIGFILGIVAGISDSM